MSRAEAERLAPHLLRIRYCLASLEVAWGACDAGTRWLYATTMEDAEELRREASTLCDLLGEFSAARGGTRPNPIESDSSGRVRP